MRAGLREFLEQGGGGVVFTYNNRLKCQKGDKGNNTPVNRKEGGEWLLPGVGGQGKCTLYERFFSVVFMNSRMTYRSN